MGRRLAFLIVLSATALSLGVFVMKGFGKDAQSSKTENTSAISEKLDEILKNQQDILSRLDNIRQELDVIRVRASRK